jgi:hypothetical protein
MAMRVVDDVLVFVHTEQTPDDVEWAQCLDLQNLVQDRAKFKVLIFSAGAAINAKQRAELKERFGAHRPPTALLTSSSVTRGVGTAIGWFNPNFKVFGPHALEEALDHLQLKGPGRIRAAAALLELKRELFGDALASMR